MHCWSENRSLESWRAYNYPHVTAVYWSLYRLARHFSPPLAVRASWRWYLTQAAKTALAMWTFGGKGGGTSQWGLMVGSVFERVLADLEREVQSATEAAGTAEADGDAASGVGELKAAFEALRDLSRKRMAKWLAMEFPYAPIPRSCSLAARPAHLPPAHASSCGCS